MGIVYGIRCKITGETYYGSTIFEIDKRMKGHLNTENKTSSRCIIERGDYDVIVLEEVEDWLLPYYEKYYIKNFPCVNKHLPFKTQEEHTTHLYTYNKQYRQTTLGKEKHNKYSSSFYKSNKETIRIQKAVLYECKCASTVRTGDKAKHFKTKRHTQTDF